MIKIEVLRNIFKRKIFLILAFNKLRIFFYKFLSSNKVKGKFKLNQPVLFMGNGKLEIGDDCIFGVISSPYFVNGYTYLDSRNPESSIYIDKNTRINNNGIIISEGEGIIIGKNVLIGFSVYISDSDGHSLEIDNRIDGMPQTSRVIIKDNVFIGSNVSISKGVTIGENSIVAKGSIVTKSFPRNSIIAGIPAKLIRTIE